MKRKIKIKDNINNKVTEAEVTVRNINHLNIQIKYPCTIQKDKRFKKPKYKNKDLDY